MDEPRSGSSNRGDRHAFLMAGSAIGRIWRQLALLAGGTASGLTGAAEPSPPPAAEPGPSEIFTFLFVTLGPTKVIAPFAKLTERADAALRRQLAWRAFYFSGAAALLAMVLGSRILTQWNVSVPALTIAGGIVLFLVALKQVMAQYEGSPPDAAPTPEPTLALALSPLTFPTIVTPYGVAVLIFFVSLSRDVAGDLVILGLLAVVLGLDLLAMLYARKILNTIGMATLYLVGTVLAILQVALAVDIILRAFVRLGVIAV